jgi:hypothetical protein
MPYLRRQDSVPPERRDSMEASIQAQARNGAVYASSCRGDPALSYGRGRAAMCFPAQCNLGNLLKQCRAGFNPPPSVAPQLAFPSGASGRYHAQDHPTSLVLNPQEPSLRAAPISARFQVDHPCLATRLIQTGMSVQHVLAAAGWPAYTSSIRTLVRVFYEKTTLFLWLRAPMRRFAFTPS